jgi:hypothetical protein
VHFLKTLLEHFDCDMLQLFDSKQFPDNQMIPRDEKRGNRDRESLRCALTCRQDVAQALSDTARTMDGSGVWRASCIAKMACRRPARRSWRVEAQTSNWSSAEASCARRWIYATAARKTPVQLRFPFAMWTHAIVAA